MPSYGESTLFRTKSVVGAPSTLTPLSPRRGKECREHFYSYTGKETAGYPRVGPIILPADFKEHAHIYGGL